MPPPYFRERPQGSRQGRKHLRRARREETRTDNMEFFEEGKAVTKEVLMRQTP